MMPRTTKKALCVRAPAVWMVTGLLLLSCARMPAFQSLPDGESPEKITAACKSVFPEGDWQFQHMLEMSLPGGKQVFFVGVVRVSETRRTIRAVVMTLDGVTLIDAGYNGAGPKETVSVHKAAPVFDSDTLARRLVRDIAFIYFEPDGKVDAVGSLKDGAHICRYRHENGQTTDVVVHPDRSWEIRRYDEGKKRLQTVAGAPPDDMSQQTPCYMSPQMTLTAHVKPHYEIRMRLVKAVPSR